MARHVRSASCYEKATFTDCRKANHPAHFQLACYDRDGRLTCRIPLHECTDECYPMLNVCGYSHQ